MLQIIYTFTPLLMRLQIKFMLTVLCTLSHILPLHTHANLYDVKIHTHRHTSQFKKKKVQIINFQHFCRKPGHL